MFCFDSLVCVTALLAGGVSGRVVTHKDEAVQHAGALFSREILSPVCPAEAWPPGPQPGQLFTPQLPDAELRDALAEIDPERIESIVRKLVSFGTRHLLSTQTDPNRGIGAARDWISSQMREYATQSEGRMTVTTPSYIQGVAERVPFPVNLTNVVARLGGVTDVLNYTADAPGADDDGSGIAVPMELARVMAKRQRGSTIIFAAVAGEEQNLYGSSFLAQQLKNASANVAGMFTNDIVGSSTGDDGTVDAHSVRLFAEGLPQTENKQISAIRQSIGGENDSPARELGRFVTEVASNDATDMYVRLIYRLDEYLRGGDHEPFLEAGYPANRFTEPHENFDYQHQDVRVENGTQYGDLPEFCDFDYIARVARVNGAALWSLAQAPPVPFNVIVDTTELTNNSTLKWLPLPDPQTPILGYEVLWRPTIAPFWIEFQMVGNVTEATIKQSKDNAIFGVRTVGLNGYKSPASFPFPG